APARDYLNHSLYGSPGFLQHGAVVAFTEEVPEVDEMKRLYRERRDMFCDTLAGLNSLDCIKPQSGIFCIVGIDRLGLAAMDFAERLYAQEGVSVLPGEAFGAEHSDWIRISLCQPVEVLREAVSRMARFVGTLNPA
ncbi:MAG: aminotransferase class I/II-fold pyridoxal phosphate-dependent enzyme, partial [Hyphomicrobiales bacterium]